MDRPGTQSCEEGKMDEEKDKGKVMVMMMNGDWTGCELVWTLCRPDFWLNGRSFVKGKRLVQRSTASTKARITLRRGLRAHRPQYEEPWGTYSGA
jgi:hypothetical protein